MGLASIRQLPCQQTDPWRIASLDALKAIEPCECAAEVMLVESSVGRLATSLADS
jgi:hypothetical protein